MKPKFWNQTPRTIQEWLVNAIDLDYDCYEYSSVEVITELLNNPNAYDINYKIVQDYYESLSEESLMEVAINSIIGTQGELNSLIEFKRELTKE
jgi:hypothetical protein